MPTMCEHEVESASELRPDSVGIAHPALDGLEIGGGDGVDHRGEHGVDAIELVERLLVLVRQVVIGGVVVGPFGLPAVLGDGDRSQDRGEGRIFVVGAVDVPQQAAGEEIDVVRVLVGIESDLHQPLVTFLGCGAGAQVAQRAGEVALFLVGKFDVAEDDHAAFDQQRADIVAQRAAQQFFPGHMDLGADLRLQRSRFQCHFLALPRNSAAWIVCHPDRAKYLLMSTPVSIFVRNQIDLAPITFSILASRPRSRQGTEEGGVAPPWSSCRSAWCAAKPAGLA